ncbi:PucR family transcriptional regulator [Cryptosporangium minutisporangium]|uniref:PucR family transcriptional regulator n=1 Tax=Cryptosporangium minutisporangium TaxID=113569 RepID=A0ABP6TE84_9ACTN
MPDARASTLDAAARVLQELRNELDDVADRILAEMLVRIPIAASASPDTVADVRGKMIETIALTIDQMVADAPLTPVTDRVRLVAVERAMTGVPLEYTILAYQIAADVLTDLAIERLAEDGKVDAATLGRALRRGMRFLQAATIGAAAGYEQVAVAAAVGRQHDQQSLLEAILADREDSASLAARVHRNGVDVRFRWAVATPAFATPGEGPSAADGAVRPAIDLQRRYPGALVGEVDGWTVMLSAAEPDELPRACGLARIAGSDYRSALRRAIRAAEVATHVGADRWDAADAAPFGALLSVPATDRDLFVRHTLGALADDEELLETLVSYLENGAVRIATARALHVHRHTLDRRLARITELLPVDPADPAARFRVRMALFFLGRFPGAR